MGIRKGQQREKQFPVSASDKIKGLFHGVAPLLMLHNRANKKLQ